MKVGTYIEVLDSRTTLDWTLCVMCRCNGENSTFSWAAVTPSDNIPNRSGSSPKSSFLKSRARERVRRTDQVKSVPISMF